MEKQLSPEDCVRAHNVLLWVAYAKRPLGPEEVVAAVLNHNISMSPRSKSPVSPFDPERGSQKFIEDLCFQLVHVEGGIVKFRHISVPEFHLSDDDLREPAIQPYLDKLRHISNAHMQLARTCLHYMTSPCFTPDQFSTGSSFDLESIHWTYPLLKYTVLHGMRHLQHLGDISRSK
jgi:hypothetical protein